MKKEKRLYLDKWLLQMLNVTCFNDNPIAKIARLVLVFQSKESKQKTYWMKSLAPPSMDKYVSIGKHGNLNQEINPWKDWILSKQWDGISRIEDFYKTVEVESKYEERKRLYLDKWLLQMLNVTCFNDDPIAKIARFVLVFQSKESKQKTYWMKSLAPPSMDKYVRYGQTRYDNLRYCRTWRT